MKLTQQDKARLLKVDARTLRNWKKDKPYLFEIIEKGFAFEKFLNETQEKINALRDFENKFKIKKS